MQRIALMALVLVAGLAMAGCEGLTRPIAKPLTKMEARSMTDSALAHRATALLADALVYDPPANASKRPIAPLRQLSFYLKPRSSGLPGLCTVTSLSLEFSPETEQDADAFSPTWVTGAGATHYFRFVDQIPMQESSDIPEEQQDAANKQCSRLEPDNVANFYAESPVLAYEGMRLLRRAQMSVSAGNYPFKLECDEYIGDCASALAELGPANFASVAKCEEIEDGKDCIRFWSVVLSLDIVTRGHFADARIESVKIEDVLYLWHLPID